MPKVPERGLPLRAALTGCTHTALLKRLHTAQRLSGTQLPSDATMVGTLVQPFEGSTEHGKRARPHEVRFPAKSLSRRDKVWSMQ